LRPAQQQKTRFTSALASFCSRRFDRRQRGRITRLERRLCCVHAPDRIGREQRQRAQRLIDHAAQAIVETHRPEVGKGRIDGLVVGRIDDLAVDTLDVSFLGCRIGNQPAVLQRRDNRQRTSVAA